MEGPGFGIVVSLANGRKLFLAFGLAYPDMVEPEAAETKATLFGRMAVSALAVIGSVASAYYFLIREKPRDPVSAAVAVGLFIFVYFAVNRALITSFEAGPGGIKILLREAKEATQSANATMEQVRELAAKIAKVGLALLPGDGRLGGMSDPARMDLKKEIVDTLLRIGLSPEQLRDATHGFTELYASLHAFRVIREFWVAHETSRDPATRLLFGHKDHNRLAKRFVNFENGHRTSPKELRKQLAEMATIAPGVDEALADYEYFLKEGTFRRPAEWEPVD
jgi:hypothetical protein